MSSQKKINYALLLLPLLLPGVVLGILWGLYGIEKLQTLPHEVAIVLQFLMGQLFLGGPPYAVFAIIVMWWGRNKTERQMRKASWFLPLIFSLIGCVLCVFASWELAIAIGLSILGFGYFYVLLAHGIIKLSSYCACSSA